MRRLTPLLMTACFGPFSEPSAAPVDFSRPVEVVEVSEGIVGTRTEFGSHACYGNRTDVLFEGLDGTLWLGCGSASSGYGLFSSADGLTWTPPVTEPADYFADFRVLDVWQDPDTGELFVAGTSNSSEEQYNANRVLRLDDKGGSWGVVSILDRGDRDFSSFTVGSFRTTGNLWVAESLTGIEALYSRGGVDGWFDAQGWWPDDEAYQILDLAVHKGEIYGCGSTINQPPQVFVPSGRSPAGFALDVIELAGTFDGELWSMVVDDSGVVAAGVNQDRDSGVIFFSGSDPTSRLGWSGLDLAQHFDRPTWVEGVCREGQELAAVGRFSRTTDGFILWSHDGGGSWEVVTPDDLGTVYDCVIRDGALHVVGADELALVMTP